MKLVKLEIELEKWGDNKGNYVGKVAMEDDSQLIMTNLSPEEIKPILDMAIENIIGACTASADKLANKLMTSYLEAQPKQIELKVDPVAGVLDE